VPEELINEIKEFNKGNSRPIVVSNVIKKAIEECVERIKNSEAKK
jgi:hypothetical protein